MKAFVFPGQGSQFPGMGKDLYERSSKVKELFDSSCDILGFDIKQIMFEGSESQLKATAVTQPAVFIHSVAAALAYDDFNPDMVAGHSLGEFSALVASGALNFDSALRLVSARAKAMQKACEAQPGTMAAILALPDEEVERICQSVDGVVVPANYNCPGQLVISGDVDAIAIACQIAKETGAKRTLPLVVGGAFHSPLMEPARAELALAIESTPFNKPICPIYQNVDALPYTNPDEIKANLIAQLTSPVRWSQTIKNMAADGADEFVELGPGQVLQGLIRKILA